MATGATTREWNGVSRRRVPRFHVEAPVDVTVARDDSSDRIPDWLNVCERGIAAVIADELVPGQVVDIEVHLSPSSDPLKAKATVRYQQHLRCGLEFVASSAEQRAAICNWARETQPHIAGKIVAAPTAKIDAHQSTKNKEGSSGGSGARWKRILRIAAIIAALAIVSGALFWWKWNRGWQELESGLHRSQSTQKPIQVPTEVMQKLLLHQVQPVYPADARSENLQGIIALDVVIGRDGSVISTRPLNGPDILARAAMDALRWWKFQPYRMNGQPVTVETTMAVEFKK